MTWKNLERPPKSYKPPSVQLMTQSKPLDVSGLHGNVMKSSMISSMAPTTIKAAFALIVYVTYFGAVTLLLAHCAG